MTSAIQCEAMAEDALLLRFGESIDEATNARVHAAARALQLRWPELELVPAYASLLLRFDPRQWPPADDDTQQQPADIVQAALADVPPVETPTRQVEIPVCYGDAFGLDLAELAASIGLSVEEVIARHSAVEYRVAMLGFAPGFPYLLGLDPVLSLPRRSDPRQRVPAGSVAIGGAQTGIYPAELPGGWRLIGRTPLQLFDVARGSIEHGSPSLLQPGDRLRFRPIDPATFERLFAETHR